VKGERLEVKDVKAQILSNKKICDSYYKMALKAPYIAKNAKPGQFVQVRCSNGIEPLLRRPFSIHRLNAQGSRLKGVEVLYEVVGKGTKILSKKKAGEFIDIIGPLGSGFTLPTASSLEPRAIIAAGGIGVAPLVFLAEELAKKKIKTAVLIGAKTKNHILCETDFKKTGAKVHVATDDGSKGCKGFVVKLLEKSLVPGPSSLVTVYACGPQPMLECIVVMCREQRLECEISLEEKMACGIGACLGCAVKVKGGTYKLVCKDGPVFNAHELEKEKI